MGALSHYTLLLASSPSTSPEESAKCKSEAKDLLLRLAEIDLDRKNRYHDMSKRLLEEIRVLTFSQTDRVNTVVLCMVSRLPLHNPSLPFYLFTHYPPPKSPSHDRESVIGIVHLVQE